MPNSLPLLLSMGLCCGDHKHLLISTHRRTGIDEQLIKTFTGHKSDAVRDYKCVSESLLRHASSTITGETSATVVKFDQKPIELEDCTIKDTPAHDEKLVLSQCTTVTSTSKKASEVKKRSCLAL